ncbi:MAG TPA: septum formation initiator family protein [Candidatus Paceibacterota bacterium]
MKFLNSKIFTILACIVVVWLVLSSIDLNTQKERVNKEVKNVETKIKEVQKDTDYLNKFLAYFQTPAFLEKEARLRLNYKAQGEEVVFIYKDKSSDINKESESISFEELLSKMPNYKKWFLYLLGY